MADRRLTNAQNKVTLIEKKPADWLSARDVGEHYRLRYCIAYPRRTAKLRFAGEHRHPYRQVCTDPAPGGHRAVGIQVTG